jgi:hypothetical protein
MLYQLKNGRCIELTVEQYLRMSDEELESLELISWSMRVEDPFAISVLIYGSSTQDEEEFDDYGEIYEEDLTDIPNEDKLTDSDFIDIDNIET